MSNVSISFHWIKSVSLEHHCDHDHMPGSASFKLTLSQSALYTGKQDEQEIYLQVNAGSVAKFNRIAEAINKIMAEPDEAPAVSDIAAE